MNPYFQKVEGKNDWPPRCPPEWLTKDWQCQHENTWLLGVLNRIQEMSFKDISFEEKCEKDLLTLIYCHSLVPLYCQWHANKVILIRTKFLKWFKKYFIWKFAIHRGKIVRSSYVTFQTCGIMRFFRCSFQKKQNTV